MFVPLICFVLFRVIPEVDVMKMTGYLHILSFVHPHRHPSSMHICGDDPYLLLAPVRISVLLLIIHATAPLSIY